MKTRKPSSNTLASSLDFAQRIKKKATRKQPSGVSQDDLPPGWIIKESRSRPGVFYYSHPSTNRSQLEHPGRRHADAGLANFRPNEDDLYGEEVEILSIDGESISDGEWEILMWHMEHEENEDPKELEKRRKAEEERQKQAELYKALQEAKKRKAKEQEKSIWKEEEETEEWIRRAMERRARERAARLSHIQEMEEEEIQTKREKKEKRQKKKEEEEARQRQEEKDREAAQKHEEMAKYEELLARRLQERKDQEKSERKKESHKAALEAKDAGNKAFQAQRFAEALKHYSKAIELDPSDAVFFSNRSGAYASCCQFKEALSDAEECLRLRPDWWKGYSRKGMAEFKLGYLTFSEKTFKKGLEMQPDEQSLKDGLAQVRAAAKMIAQSSVVSHQKAQEVRPDAAQKAAEIRRREALVARQRQEEIEREALLAQAEQKAEEWRKNQELFARQRHERLERDEAERKREERARADTERQERREREEADRKREERARAEKERQERREREEADRKREERARAEKERQERREREEADRKREEKARAEKERQLEKERKERKERLAEEMRARQIVSIRRREEDSSRSRSKKKRSKSKRSRSRSRSKKKRSRSSSSPRRRKKRSRSLSWPPTGSIKTALEAKNAGNVAFQAQRFEEAVRHYTKAIQFDPKNAVFFSNRSGAYVSCNRYKEALSDAKECMRLRPEWWKAYSRKAMAEFKLGHLTDSEASFKKGLAMQPDEQSLKDGLAQVRLAVAIGLTGKDSKR